MSPEASAREKTDAPLAAAGWVVRDGKAFNLSVARGIAIREVSLASGRYDHRHKRRFTCVASITTNIAHLTPETFVEIEIPLPPLAEQARVVAGVERRLTVVEELEALVQTNVQRAVNFRRSTV